MTTEQQREMLEYAAKAMQEAGDKNFRNFDVCAHAICLQLGHRRGAITGYWNPLTNPADTAEMCAKLEINHEHHSDYIQCLWAPQETYHVITMLKDHDNSRLKAWMWAATMVAAEIGGYENAHP